jgi:hypothetical protein
MTGIVAKPLLIDLSLPTDGQIARVEYVPNCLVVGLRTPDDSVEVLVEFPAIIGFRVLDERDLMEFWPECSSPHGKLFEILAGGWLSQELLRPGSLLGPMNIRAREYFLTGSDDCVSVISPEEPIVRKGTL